MKIILSRKGFDSAYGGCASPIFPDEFIASLPIPASPNDKSKDTMGDLPGGLNKLGDVVSDLTMNRKTKSQYCASSKIHWDPQLVNFGNPEWRPAFGQDGAAQGHLRNQKIGLGDIFLFFGWFRRVELGNGSHWRFSPGEPDLHVIFGWLQIGEQLHIGVAPKADSYPQWLAKHPHIVNAKSYVKENTIYVGSKNLVLGDEETVITGGGAFDTYAPERQLTHPEGPSRSNWRLPAWFDPFSSSSIPRRPPLTYHRNPKNWSPQDSDNQTVSLRAADIGQEFVLDCAQYPEAIGWLREKIFADKLTYAEQKTANRQYPA